MPPILSAEDLCLNLRNVPRAAFASEARVQTYLLMLKTAGVGRSRLPIAAPCKSGEGAAEGGDGVNRAETLHAPCARVTANSLRPFAWCVVCALTLSRTALMHLETAGEGPPNQVLQPHKTRGLCSVHCYMSLLFCWYFVLWCYLMSQRFG